MILSPLYPQGAARSALYPWAIIFRAYSALTQRAARDNELFTIYDSRFTAFNPTTPATTPANSTSASSTADT